MVRHDFRNKYGETRARDRVGHPEFFLGAHSPRGTLEHRRTGSKIQGAALLNSKSDGICREFKSDRNIINVLPFWAVFPLFGRIWRVMQGFRRS